MLTTRQYPQYLYVRHNGQSQQTADGAWQATADRWKLWSICREQTSALLTADGLYVNDGSRVYLPGGTSPVPQRAEIAVLRIKVQDDVTDADAITEALVVQGSCQRFDAGRLHCRMWI